MPMTSIPYKTIDMVSNQKYITGNGDNFIVFNLPEQSKVGDTLEIYCTAPFKVQPKNKQQIIFFAVLTTLESLQGCIIAEGKG